MAVDDISEEGRRQRFARWEQLGLDQVKHDLLNGGHRLVGGPPAVRELAWEWVRGKEAEQVMPASETTLGRMLNGEGPGTLRGAIQSEMKLRPATYGPAGRKSPQRPGAAVVEPSPKEILTIRPAFAGIGLDLKELWRREIAPRLRRWRGRS
jgi:hypothetical protein